MNHYPHHIGDFNTATRHLSRLERSVYRDMLDMYYDTETALDGSNFDRLARRLVCVTADEVAALQFVLDEFFEHTDDGRYVHHRCERELASFKAQQASNGVVKSNEKDRQTRSRARRSAIFSALRHVGEAPPWNAKMRELLALCRQHGIAVPTDGPVTPPVTAGAVSRHAPDTANQNQNQNQEPITPPNPPAGGACDADAAPMKGRAEEQRAGQGTTATTTATALCAFFPEKRRTRLAEVSTLIASLEADGTVTGEQLLQAAAQQADRLTKDEGKACPSVLRWLREQRWLDGAADAAQVGAVPADWRDSRSGVEAMGERLGLGRWDESKHRLFAQYEAQVVAALEAQGAAVGA